MGRIDLSKRISLIVAATVVAGNLAFADAAKSCITDLRLNNDGSNVKVNIYTDKPYTDSVVVSKKEGNRYVILVPETTSSVKSAPRVSGGGNISVSMQSVSAGKGYTKITIVSDKAINVVPKTYTSSAPVKSAVQPAKPVVKQTAQSTKPAQPVKTVKPAVKQVKIAKPAVKVVKDTPKPVQKPAVSKPVKKTVAPQPIKQTVTKPIQTPAVQPAKPDVTRNKPIDILEQEVKTDKVKEIKQTEPDALLEQTIKDNDTIIQQRKLKKRKFKRKKYAPILDPQLTVKQSIKLVLEEAKTISLWKLLLLASAISFPIVVIMVILGMDKRINKRIDMIRKNDDIRDIERELKEDVAAVRAQKAAQQEPVHQEPVQQEVAAQEPVVQTQQFSSFEDMLDRVEEPQVDAYEEAPLMEYAPEPVDDMVDTSDFELEEPIQPEQVVENLEEFETVDEPLMEEPVEELADDPNIADMTDDLTVDEYVQPEPVVEPVQPELVEKPELSSEEEHVVEEIVPYNPDGVLADFSNVNDKEFFDELVLQSLAEKDVDNLPENTPADEIFGVMTEDESGILLSDFESKNFEQESTETSGDSDDVTMLNEAKIDDKSGLYLVNYDNFSSLVGHVADDYFVIKKFDEIVNGNIIVKQAEKTDKSIRYLVRVGRNKMIVEVDDKSMNRLIDL